MRYGSQVSAIREPQKKATNGAKHALNPSQHKTAHDLPSRSKKGPMADRSRCGSVAAKSITRSDPSTLSFRSTSFGRSCGEGRKGGLWMQE